MAYRKLEVNDSVRITGSNAYDGKYHGYDGTVLEVLDNAAKVRFYDKRVGECAYKELWFYNRNLVITRDSPNYIAPEKQTTPTLAKEKQMSTFKIGDKVRVIGCSLFCEYTRGMEGVITRINNSMFYVTFEEGDVDYGYAHDLELVTPKVTENPAETAAESLAQKLDALDALTAEIRAMVGL